MSGESIKTRFVVGRDFGSLFEQDNFAFRRTTGHNLYDPESLITGAELARGLTYTNSRRGWLGYRQYHLAARGYFDVETIAAIAERRLTVTMKRCFRIPRDKNVLVLEDCTEQRIPWFRARLPHALIIRNPLIAIEALRARDFHTVFVDFDCPCPQWRNGLDVALYLVEVRFTGRVIVHSSDMFGSARIGETLRREGIHTIIAEFGDFEAMTCRGENNETQKSETNSTL